MKETECWFFHCHSCNQPMLLPLETLRQQLPNQVFPSSGYPFIAVGCLRCKQIRNYSLEPHFQYADPLGKVVSSIPSVEMHCEWMLRCEEEICGSLIVVFVALSTDTKWEWTELCCENGHVVLPPR